MPLSPRAPTIRISELDTQRFGVASARVENIKDCELEAITYFCHQQKIQFLIARCDVSCIDVVQKLENDGYRLMDTLLSYEFDFQKRTPAKPATAKGFRIRALQPGEEHEIRQIAREIFHNYAHSHYHADPRLNRDQCNEVYPDWAYQCCIHRHMADRTLVAEAQGKLVGFLSLKDQGEIVLNGVLPAFRGMSIYSNLVSHALQILQSVAPRVAVATPLTNLVPRRIWARAGFEPVYAQYTFHKWFSDS